MKELLKRRSIRIVLSLAMVVGVLGPIAAYGNDGFTDVPDTNIFHSDIKWLADNGITQGCNPPGNTEFCPSDNVTREQMAAFMRRLSVNQVVDAATAVMAEDSNFLDGWTGSYYTNPIDGAACEGTACPSAAALTLLEVLTLTVNTSRSGVLQLSSMVQADQGGTNDLVQSWLTIDAPGSDPCGGWLIVPVDGIPGSYGIMFLDGNISQGTISTSTAVEVSGGVHTVRLCVLGSDPIDTFQAGLTSVFSATGSVTITPSTASFAPEQLAKLEAIFGPDAEALN